MRTCNPTSGSWTGMVACAAVLASGCCTLPTAAVGHFARLRGDDATCDGTRVPRREEEERFAYARVEDRSRLARLKRTLRRTAWWQATGVEQPQLSAHELTGLVEPGANATVVSVDGRSEGKHVAALFVLRQSRDEPDTVLRTDLLWSSDHEMLRELGFMEGDDNVPVLYWEAITPRESPSSGMTTEQLVEQGVQPVGRYERIGYGWLAWYEDGEPVVRPRTCQVIPPV